jgi:hypothetical protein
MKALHLESVPEAMCIRGGLLIAAMAVALCGCDRNGRGTHDRVAGAHVPPSVQALIDAEFPVDGQFRVRSQGRLKVKPKTSVCRIRATIDPGLKRAAPAFYGPGIEGVDNGYLNEDLNGQACINDGDNIISYWLLVKNRTNRPYKLIFSAWQGDPAQGGALWVGGVERSEGWRPDTKPEMVMGEEDRVRPTFPFLEEDGNSAKRLQQRNATRLSVVEDTRDISRAFRMAARKETSE